MKRLFAPFKLLRDLGVLTFAFALALLGTLAFAQTWTEPTQSPPDGNVPAPINVGADAQDKAGPLGVGALAVFGETTFTGDTVDFEFTNTGAAADTLWRMARNDGLSNWSTNLNTEGGFNPTFLTDGHAFRESYNAGEGVYRFQTSGGSGVAGNDVDWTTAIEIRSNGTVYINGVEYQPLPQCEPNQMLKVNAEGNWSCATDDTGTGGSFSCVPNAGQTCGDCYGYGTIQCDGTCAITTGESCGGGGF
ncbi:MAG: hypothetical protein ACOC4E_01495 [Patescibacteria group bacterium]